MEKIRHELRLSETITPFGVGAITDIRGESLMAADTSWWDPKVSPEISCDRLIARLGAGTLRQPPTHSGRAAKGAPALVYCRFPAWRFCERCEKLSKLTGRKKGKWDNHCECGGPLVPMRFVAVCRKGSHIQDIPWFQWVHRGREAGLKEEVRLCRAHKELRFLKFASHGEGLESLVVKCFGCGNSRSLSELSSKGALQRDGIRCNGRQPWEPEDDSRREPCLHPLVAVQRGATGNYIADRISALDIPEERPLSLQLADRIRRHDLFDRLVADNGGPQSELIAGWIADELETPVEVVLAVAGGEEVSTGEMLLDLKDGEWAAFLKKLPVRRDRSADDFVVDGRTLDEANGPASLLGAISGVGQVRRVREVRALRYFSRYDADAALVRPDLGMHRSSPIYPAVEVFGEGIFLRFDEKKLAEWESRPEVQARAGILKRRRADMDWASKRLVVPEPRFIALHTLAHLLIRRLAFESGYASASLQERIYANPERLDKTAGIFIYTAAGDAQGTLGGLVRLGEPEKLIPLLVSALEDADLCSNDPVCIESDSQGASQLNLSACHGCALVSETSCETGNRLLDRQLVLGGSEVRGLLDGVLEEARSVTVEG
ncbi:DrmB family protein [Saccharomonospora azurea]|uniref:DrmB family protein n=1 Tax=Saccharomonospora azurea TaxID=40988 RepID=UPI003D8FBD5E